MWVFRGLKEMIQLDLNAINFRTVDVLYLQEQY